MPSLIRKYVPNVQAEEKAKKKLLAFLNELWGFGEDAEFEAYVEFWERGKWGLRIAEIGYVRKDHMGGATSFRNEKENALIFLRCEDLLLEWAYHVGNEDDIEFFKEQIRSVERTTASKKRKKGA